MFTEVDWKLKQGIASRGNLLLLLVVLLLFPFVLPWTGALSVASIPPSSGQHTAAFLRFCFTVTGFLWLCFLIAFAGVRSRSLISCRDLIGVSWRGWPQFLIRDLGIALCTLIVLAIIGNLSNVLLGPFQHNSALFRSMVARNSAEAFAFLLSALTAGFVEEFIFRGYLQRQFTALFGSVRIAAVFQVGVFTVGHLYQGWTRLVPVVLVGAVLTLVAIKRKSLVPGMIAHGFGDGLVAFVFFAKRF